MLGTMKPRVLVVDDELGVRRALQRGLGAEGMDVVTAADGPAALDIARTGAFDVILLDIMLPGLSGYRVLQAAARGGRDARRCCWCRPRTARSTRPTGSTSAPTATW